MTSIVITRDSGLTDRARKYRVICNSIECGLIGNGETRKFDLSPGDYEVFLKIDWCRSNKLKVTLSEGESAEFEAGSSLRGFKLFLSIFYIFLLPSKYLWLTEKNS